jgi:hypothetical protein
MFLKIIYLHGAHIPTILREMIDYRSKKMMGAQMNML